jgi:3-deoxy-7-phosphoheptulonate synthase
MIFLLKENASKNQCMDLKNKLTELGLTVVAIKEKEIFKIGVIEGKDEKITQKKFCEFPFIEKIISFKTKSKLASREFKKEDTVIEIKGHKIGGDALTIIAGPCAIESKEQMMMVAKHISSSGATVLRGGAFKPRTSPYDFQGLGEEGLKYLKEAGDKYGLITISEVMDIDQIDIVAKYADILQVGTRNMQNFSLLKKLGKIDKPILLKRGFSATYQDLIMAAEYIMREGNLKVILCERGIRTFENYTRNTLDLAAVPILKKMSHLPVIVDPSHGTGIRDIISPMSKAAVAAGANGIMVEVHPNPEESISDANQTICLEEFAKMIDDLKLVAKAVGIKIY